MKIFTVEYMRIWSHTAKWVPNWSRWLGWLLRRTTHSGDL